MFPKGCEPSLTCMFHNYLFVHRGRGIATKHLQLSTEKSLFTELQPLFSKLLPIKPHIEPAEPAK